MKKAAALLLASGLYGLSFAQGLNDVVHLNPVVQWGTPRYMATGGAFTSLGNDFSAVHLNPAGLAVFRHNEFGVAMGAGNRSVSSTYYGTNQTENWTNFLFASLGYTARFTTKDPDITWNLGITYNRNSDFSAASESFGVNTQSSILQDWLFYADGIQPDDLLDYGLVYERLAYESYLLDADQNGTYSTQAEFTSTEQFFAERTTGRFDELGISVAIDHSDKFYLGGSMNFPFYRYDVEYFYEEAGYGGDSIRGMQWLESFTNRGVGINFKVGAIYRPIPNVRLGASIFSPTWMGITQEYQTQVTGKYANGGSQTAAYVLDPFDYNMRNAPQANLGASYVFNQNGFISVDYTFLPTTWSGTTTEALSYLKEDIDAYLNNQHSIRVGGEIRLVSVYLRGGYSFLSNPYNLEWQDAARKGIHMGVGYRTNRFTIDIGYSIMQENYNYYPYSAEIVQPARQTISRKPFVASASFRL